jgi:hypothetical protein
LKGRLLLLNLLLLASCAAAFWRLKAMHEERIRRQEAFLKERVTPAPAPPLSLPAPAPQVSAANYLPVAQTLLFSKDRNPDVVIEVAAPKPPPPLPRYFGLMNFGEGPRVILAAQGQPQKTYSVGDTVGEFRLAAVEPEGLVFEWEDRTIRAKFEELRDKSGAAAQQADAQPSSMPPQPGQAQEGVSTLSAVSTITEVKGPGQQASERIRLCQPGDTSPSGTVVDGYRKIIRNGPFGPQCMWEKLP